ncbi:MAG: ABC transporter permease [Roseivirga sp.]
MSQKSPIPPKWPDRFLGWYCNDQVREQVQGDAHELFYWRLEDKGLARARRSFVWDVFRLFKWSNIKRTNRQKQKLNSIAMFKNYFKIGLRNLWKQKMPSTINIIGLSLAVGCCLVSFKWIESNLVKDQFHERAEDTYLITPTRKTEDGDKIRYAKVVLAAAEMVKEEVPGVDMVNRYAFGYGQVKVKNAKFGNSFVFTDPSFFDVFSYKIIHGDKTALDDPRSVVLSEGNALAFFGDEYPVGQQLNLEINGEEKSFVVSAVIENAPDNSSMRPGLLVNFSLLEAYADPLTKTTFTFIVLNESVKPASLASSLDQIREKKNALTPKTAYLDISLEPLVTMAKNGQDLANGFGGPPPLAPFVLLTCIGGFMLLLATSNYVNIATVMAMKRVKEIGVRKVIGGRRQQLIVQFLTENLLLCTLAMVVGCLLASAFFIPGFNDISGSNLRLALLEHRNLWWFLIILLVFITLVSGAYPAFYISSFKPVSIFRGSSQKGGKKRLTGALLTFQMILAVITIVAGIMFVQTNRQNESRDWGYDQYDKIVLRKPEGQSYETLSAELAKLPNIEAIAGSRGVIGQFQNYKRVDLGENRIQANVFQCDEKYPALLQTKLKEGAFFSEAAKTQNARSLVVNETFMNRLQLSLDDQQTVVMDSTNFNIIGVVEDFHFSTFSEVIQPAAFQVVADSLLYNMTVQVRAGTSVEMKEKLENLLSDLDPEKNRYSVGFQDEVFNQHFEEMKGIGNIMVFTASLAVLLSAMGLFGLVSLSISSRQKDFSIKKVLGANLRQLSGDIYKRFMLILGLAIVIGGAISVFLIGMLLDSAYGYHDSIGIVPLTLAGIILMGVAAVTINTQVRNVKRMNPAETLRAE